MGLSPHSAFSTENKNMFSLAAAIAGAWACEGAANKPLREDVAQLTLLWYGRQQGC